MQSEKEELSTSAADEFKSDLKLLGKVTKKEAGYDIDEKEPEKSFYAADVVTEDGQVKVQARFKLKIKDIWGAYKNDIVIGVFFLLYLIATMGVAYSFYYDVIYLGYADLPLNVGSEVMTQVMSAIYCFVLPVILWAKSTDYVFWNYRFQKITMLRIMVIAMIINTLLYIYRISYALMAPLLIQIEVTSDMSAKKIVGLGYTFTLIPLGLTLIAIYYVFLKNLFETRKLEEIEKFRLKHILYLNPKQYSKYEYNMKTISRMSNGQRYTMLLLDRMLHCAFVAPTGGGKTSSAFKPAIADDLYTRVLNEDKLKKELLKGIEKNKFRLRKPFDDFNFSKEYFEAKEGHEKEFNVLIKKYVVAGATIVAPDDSLTDDIYELCMKYGVPSLRMDPKWQTDGTNKPGFVGFNPFYLSPSIPDWARKPEIVKRAILFADVMQSLATMGEDGSDPYFSSINRIVGTTLSILVMVGHPLIRNGEQPNPLHLLDLVNDFDAIYPYVVAIRDVPELSKQYKVILDIAEKSFIDPMGRKRYEEHSSGFKVLLNNFLLSDYIQRIFTAEKVVDFDHALEHGEVVLVNIEQGDLGPVNSAALGLFTSVSFINSVLRRPGNEWSRNYHFAWFDEFPVYVSPTHEFMFVLFRKFRVAVNVAMQTTDQMLKNSYLSYLKGIITNSCGHIIMFGRANVNDMDLISQLAGEIDAFVEQKGTMETHMSVEAPTISTQRRTTAERRERVSTSDVRSREFQEVTVLGTREGTALPAFHGKLHFLNKSQTSEKKRFRVDWEKLYQKQEYQEEMTYVSTGTENATPLSAALKPEQSASKIRVLNTVTDDVTEGPKTASTIATKNGAMGKIDDLLNRINADEAGQVSNRHDTVNTYESDKVNVKSNIVNRVSFDDIVNEVLQDEDKGDVSLFDVLEGTADHVQEKAPEIDNERAQSESDNGDVSPAYESVKEGVSVEAGVEKKSVDAHPASVKENESEPVKTDDQDSVDPKSVASDLLRHLISEELSED